MTINEIMERDINACRETAEANYEPAETDTRWKIACGIVWFIALLLMIVAMTLWVRYVRLCHDADKAKADALYEVTNLPYAQGYVHVSK